MPAVLDVPAEIACTGGQKDVHTENVGTITGRLSIHTTKLIQIGHLGQPGVNGTSQESRNTGAEEEAFTRFDTVSIL